MNKLLHIAALLAVALMAAEPALAQVRPMVRAQTQIRVLPRLVQPSIKPPLPLLAKIKPSQAAAIAKRSVPSSTVIGVKLLPSGNYAVTLRANNAVTRVTVDGSNGSIQ